MKRICLLSDTHGYIAPDLEPYLNECDEIWHAGDIGTIETADTLAQIKPLRAVYGNIDNHIVRSAYPLDNIFDCEGVSVWMTHIGGYPGNYEPRIKKNLLQSRPTLFISGHSHILKVIYDKKIGLLHLNPGAAGIVGFHKIRTLLRFSLDGGEIRELSIVEMPKKLQQV
jgi:uncharacterized protein